MSKELAKAQQALRGNQSCCQDATFPVTTLSSYGGKKPLGRSFMKEPEGTNRILWCRGWWQFTRASALLQEQKQSNPHPPSQAPPLQITSLLSSGQG